MKKQVTMNKKSILSTFHQENIARVVLAMESELDNFMKFDTFYLVDDMSQPRLSRSWVITKKPTTPTGVKARLVIHGNQEECPTRTDSPIVKKTSLRLQFSIHGGWEKPMLKLAVQHSWRMRKANVKAAFLQQLMENDGKWRSLDVVWLMQASAGMTHWLGNWSCFDVKSCQLIMLSSSTGRVEHFPES